MSINQSTIISHNGKRIFFSDYTNLSGEAFVNCINRHHKHQMEFIESENDTILVLTDVTGANGDREAIVCFKEKTQVAEKHIRKSAVIGVIGIQKVLLKGVNRFSRLNSKIFDSREDALQWLVE